MYALWRKAARNGRARACTLGGRGSECHTQSPVRAELLTMDRVFFISLIRTLLFVLEAVGGLYCHPAVNHLDAGARRMNVRDRGCLFTVA